MSLEAETSSFVWTVVLDLHLLRVNLIAFHRVLVVSPDTDDSGFVVVFVVRDLPFDALGRHLFPFQVHVLHCFLILRGPDTTDGNIDDDRDNEAQAPPDVPKICRSLAHTGTQTAAEAREGNHCATGVGNVGLNIPAPNMFRHSISKQARNMRTYQ